MGSANSSNAWEGSLLAIDVGNSSVKLGWFPASGDCPGGGGEVSLTIAPTLLPTPAEMVRVAHRGRPVEDWLVEVGDRLDELVGAESAACVTASVRSAAAEPLAELLSARRWTARRTVAPGDLPLQIRVAAPERVGVDRLLGAVAANRFRAAGRVAAIVDVGTATTINWLDAGGAFCGGAILAGPATALAGLSRDAPALPVVRWRDVSPSPAAIGGDTQAALASGAYWGAVGAIGETIRRMAEKAGNAPQIFLTGGGSIPLAGAIEHAGEPARYVPHLVLSGLALSVRRGFER